MIANALDTRLRGSSLSIVRTLRKWIVLMGKRCGDSFRHGVVLQVDENAARNVLARLSPKGKPILLERTETVGTAQPGLNVINRERII